jgi:hypothetical protein
MILMVYPAAFESSAGVIRAAKSDEGWRRRVPGVSVRAGEVLEATNRVKSNDFLMNFGSKCEDEVEVDNLDLLTQTGCRVVGR